MLCEEHPESWPLLYVEGKESAYWLHKLLTNLAVQVRAEANMGTCKNKTKTKCVQKLKNKNKRKPSPCWKIVSKYADFHKGKGFQKYLPSYSKCGPSAFLLSSLMERSFTNWRFHFINETRPRVKSWHRPEPGRRWKLLRCFHQEQLANFTLYNVDVNCPLTRWASSQNKNVGGLLGKAHAGPAGQDSVSYQRHLLILSF